MKTPSNINPVREVLLANPDGLTAKEIADLIGAKHLPAIYKRLRSMPDAYIDRWDAADAGWVSVWQVVKVPPNRERPDGPMPGLSNSKLTRRQVLEVKVLHAQRKTMREISKLTGVSRSTVSRIVSGIGCYEGA